MLGTIAGIITAIILAIYDLYYHRCNYDGGKEPTMESYMTSYLGSGELDVSTLSHEYNRYIYVQRILNETPGHNFYEKRNSVERLLLAMANLNAKQENAHDTILAELPENHELYKQFAVEMQSKNKVDINPKYIINIISQYFASSPKPITFNIIGGKFTCGTYSRDIAPERMQLLRKLGGDEATAIMLMRYASILPGSQHWNLPLTSYKHLYAEGFRVEGFASPVNSQMLLCGQGKFCSLFPDVDAPFGSIGSFFGADLVGNSVVVNPPYLESIFIAVGKKLTAECDRAASTSMPTRFFVTFAAWRDSKGYLELLNSKYTRLAVILPAGSHYYGNTNAVSGGRVDKHKRYANKRSSTTHADNTKVVARFDTAIFELIAGYDTPPPELDLEKFLATNQADPNIKHERLV